MLLDAAGPRNLEQLIIIFNEDVDDPLDLTDESHIYSELMEANLPKFTKLRYFEFSLYNETTDPSFTQE